MLRRDGPIIDFRRVDAAVKLSPQAVQQGRTVFEAFFVGVQVVLEVFRQPVFIGAFPKLPGGGRFPEHFPGRRLHGVIEPPIRPVFRLCL